MSVNSPSPMETDTSSGTQVTVVLAAMVLVGVANKRLIVWKNERFQLSVLKWFENAYVCVCLCVYAGIVWNELIYIYIYI